MSVILSKKSDVLRFLTAISFLIIVVFFTVNFTTGNTSVMLVVAAVIGGYMAMNIGASDVAF